MADVELLQAENEQLRAEVREAREFRDKMANAIGNDQLRRFIEKHGEPVPLTIRMQEAEARAERLAEALRLIVEEVDDLLASHPKATTYPDGPCIEEYSRSTLADARDKARAALEQEASRG